VLRAGRRSRRGAIAVAIRPRGASEGGDASTRVGYAVGRRVGGAVVRNRVRRRLRALVRELLSDSAPAIDIVITAYAEAAVTPFAALRRDLAFAFRAVGVDAADAGTPGQEAPE
jgi:ribonuclease P protein component